MVPFGPAPEARIPLSPARARVLSAVASLGGDARPVTLTEISDLLGGHPNTSRQHLDALTANGLLDVSDIARSMSGRRPHGYTLTEAGRLSLAPSSGDGYREIVEAVVAHHKARGRGPEEARMIGQVWGEQRAATLQPAAAADPGGAVTDMLAMLGFDPAPAPDGDGLLLRSCPLHSIAKENPDFACALHQGMVTGVVRRLGGTSHGVRLLPFDHPHGCRLRFGALDEGAQPA